MFCYFCFLNRTYLWQAHRQSHESHDRAPDKAIKPLKVANTLATFVYLVCGIQHLRMKSFHFDAENVCSEF